MTPLFLISYESEPFFDSGDWVEIVYPSDVSRKSYRVPIVRNPDKKF
jgi:hypothetical protein